MPVANHEASLLEFPGLSGVFDPQYPIIGSGWWLGDSVEPYSGVMAEAVQSVAVTTRSEAENLLAIGYKGHAGYSKRFGGVDVNIDAVLTDNVNVSGAYGFELSQFDAQLSDDLRVFTTNSTVGKKVTVTGLYVNSISFNFNQNDNSTTSWTFVGDGVMKDDYIVATSGAVGNVDYHCVNPLTWDEIHIYDTTNGVVLTGVQTATFTANINRQDVFQIGQFTPYDRSVQYPYNVTVTLNTFANDVRLTNWWDKFVPDYDPQDDCDGGLIIKVRTQPIAGQANARDFIIASGLRPTTSTLNAAVGTNSTVALTFEGTDLRF